MDAAVAAAGVLAVVRPHMNGVGGDAFALYYEASTGRVHALNGSGRAGALATPRFFAGHDRFPGKGPMSVSVPGAVAAWADAVERFGTRPLGRLLEPAIGYARDGFPVSTRLAFDFEQQGGDLNEAGRAQFLPGGSPPPAGSLLKNQALARTLERIAREGKDGFYRGPVAERISEFLLAQGGHLGAEDFASHTSTWVDPLRTDYLEHRFYMLPPSTQGVAQLQMMAMAKSMGTIDLGHNTSPYLHTLVEAKKLAFADRDRWVADPALADVPVSALTDPDYLIERARLIDASRAAQNVRSGIGTPTGGAPGAEPAGADAGSARAGGDPVGSGAVDDLGDTVFLTVVDADGNAVSWIQSLFAGFGSGLFEPETGVMLHNRAGLFTLEPGHPNRVAPGKRPFHTLSPLLATHPGGELAFTLGTPGGDSQPQSLLQIVNNLLAFGMTPQEAIEAPRFRSNAGTRLLLEDRITPEVRARLAALGHEVRIVHGWTATFGGAQMIHIDPESGTITAAADPRREAYAIAY
jgi:gamma-glutamyltranspeptidase/glutathione hydrolase